MVQYRFIATYIGAIVLGLFILFLPYIFENPSVGPDKNELRILTYSSFIQDWGPGPEIVRLFEKEAGVKVKWINAGNAGLLLERLKFKKQSDRPDIVLGFDQFSILEARKAMAWTDVKDIYKEIQKNLTPQGSNFHDFLAYDWGPMTFVYRESEVEPPKHIDDLISHRFEEKLILQDPRMSSPGLQFFFWLLHLKGEEETFRFLKKLKPSVKVLAPSWSSSYSIFQVEKKTMTFSYFTSPYFHEMEEKDRRFKPIVFEHPHPVQVEYVGIPTSCFNCEKAKEFLKFLVRPQVQKVIMNKNFMFPVEEAALKGSVFKVPGHMKFFDPVESWSLIRKKKELVNRWKKVFY